MSEVYLDDDIDRDIPLICLARAPARGFWFFITWFIMSGGIVWLLIGTSAVGAIR